MTYMPVEPKLCDDKQDKPDERRRRRIAGLLGAGAVSILALLVKRYTKAGFDAFWKAVAG
jgi:hypothetical protein